MLLQNDVLCVRKMIKINDNGTEDDLLDCDAVASAN